MINDLAFSARAERTRKILRRLAAFAVGAGVSLASFAAFGAESPGLDRNKADAVDRFVLPPVPYGETMPWLNWEPATATMKVDTLLSPVLGPSGIRLDLTPSDREGLQPAMS